MRIVIDLQGAQGASRHRGIGRYSLEFTRSFLSEAGAAGHEVHIALSELFPEQISSLRNELAPLVNPDRIHVWTTPAPVAMMRRENASRVQFAELMREGFLASLAPDLVIVSSLMEGGAEDIVTSIGKYFSVPTAVLHYDLIPYVYPHLYLPAATHKEWYSSKIESLKRADMVMTISEFSRAELIRELGFDEDKVINISAAGNEVFCRNIPTEADKGQFRSMGIVKPYLLHAGASDERKNLSSLVNAYARLPEFLRNSHQLVLAGRMPREHLRTLKNVVAASGLRKGEVVFTGPIEDQLLVALYNGCKLFAFPSWHEGFGLPALEAMQCGRAVIASNCSSVPEVVGRSDALFDPHDEKSMAAHIRRGLEDEQWRLELERWGLERAAWFSWGSTARRALNAIEGSFSGRSRTYSPTEIEQVLTAESADVLAAFAEEPLLVRRRKYEDKIRQQYERAHGHPWTKEKFVAWGKRLGVNKLKLHRPFFSTQGVGETFAEAQLAIKLNFPTRARKRQLFVDVSELVMRDAGTGIQRVVRNIVKAWLRDPPSGWEIVPVYATTRSDGYFRAGHFPSIKVSDEGMAVSESALGSPGDVFLALDFQRRVFPAQGTWLQAMRRRGVRVVPVLYDMLPIQFPQFFNSIAVQQYEKWLQAVLSCDGVICISRTVAHELGSWLRKNFPDRARSLSIDWFHLGSDLDGGFSSRQDREVPEPLSPIFDAKPTFLMVGTVEPRKGHRIVIDAFQRLWATGLDVNLVVVGREGWLVRRLARQMRSLRTREHRFIWLETSDDGTLEQLYRNSTALIAASFGEGFGLPLIEAARFGLPIIARDIPVFREAVADGAFFFPADCDADDMIQILRRWLQLYQHDNHPKSAFVRIHSWKESADALFAAMLRINEQNGDRGAKSMDRRIA